MSHPHHQNEASGENQRRTFLSRVSGLAMVSGLLAGYGTFTHMAGKFLYPAKKAEGRWYYVALTSRITRGGSIDYRAPNGARITIARAPDGEPDGFIALSSICPHLGCQVHWEGQNNRFFCPCHNGAFDRNGKATAGPPLEAGQFLSRYPLKVEGELLYIEIQSDVAELLPEGEVISDEARPTGPGQDPCLFQRPRGESQEF